ncbi:cysteine dioxygenase family protein [Streptomyces sp. LP05-1]|uniref:Cysteine dioxygenase family protein n=1 Tax=Streptomyces pyxinae TaxID=2970734 RepID=A0ABT2CA25_9ACTN|nr:cysteine dioxygenase family protein [Streptomyces sp. LP05-1]MCS0634250.1 cysteine dioxygenase family protein [Streptomyces sp. LP05-1]
MHLMERISSAFDTLLRPTPQQLREAWENVGASLDEILPYAGDPGVYPYGRKKLYASQDIEILAMNWAARRPCAPHDHGQSFGWINVMSGTVRHTLYTLDQDDIPVPFLTREEPCGSRYFAPRSVVHSMENPSDGLTVTLHLYAPPITGMRVYDLERCAACVVSDDCGAWWPDEQRQLVRRIKLSRATAGEGAM